MQKYVKGQPLSGQGASGFIAPNNSLMKSLDNLDKIVDETQQKTCRSMYMYVLMSLQ